MAEFSDQARSLLLTDLYQLNMLQVYFDNGMNETAAFEFFVRALPASRGFLMVCGLEQALDWIEQARFKTDEIAFLRGTGWFSDDFLNWLANFRFSGEVSAMPEGRVFFADEPVIRIVAPLMEAQLIETRLINLMQHPIMIASKAARCVLAAPDKALIEFGMRRAHGAEAALLGARAAYVAGFAGTSVVSAMSLFGEPIAGTMAHSFIQAHDDETAAFEAYARARPEAVILLLDTYDTIAAAHKVVALARRLAADGIDVKGVRLDSGDLIGLSRAVRRILDDGGLTQVRIFASGGLDEYKLQALDAGGAAIDSYGVGTSLATSADAPWLNCVYKLQEYAGVAKRKYAEGKQTWPGRKQVWRRHDLDTGEMAGDRLTLAHESAPGEPLLSVVMRDGRRVAPHPGLDAVRTVAAEDLARLPTDLRALKQGVGYPVTVSPALRDLAAEVDHRMGVKPTTRPATPRTAVVAE